MSSEQTGDFQHLEDQDSYALIVKGRSMIEDRLCDGDYVVIKRQTTCEDGDIIVVVHLIQGSDGQATLKRFFQEEDIVRLQSAHAESDPMCISRREWDCEWQVQGKVVAIFRPSSGSGHAASGGSES